MKSVYREYFQKSKVFILPLLGIVKGHKITPVETYIAWREGDISPGDGKLVSLYLFREDMEYKAFESEKLTGNKLFHSKHDVEDNKMVYVFNVGKSKDWASFVSGKYSKLSESHKKIIKLHYKQSSNLVYIESFVHPEKYYAIYAELLGTSIETLKQVGELTSAPDIQKETLTIKLKTNDKHAADNLSLER